MNKALLRVVLFVVLTTLATFALCLLAGDDTFHPLPLGQWLFYKMLGLLLALSTFALGYWADKRYRLFE